MIPPPLLRRLPPGLSSKVIFDFCSVHTCLESNATAVNVNRAPNSIFALQAAFPPSATRRIIIPVKTKDSNPAFAPSNAVSSGSSRAARSSSSTRRPLKTFFLGRRYRRLDDQVPTPLDRFRDVFGCYDGCNYCTLCKCDADNLR